MILLCGIPSEPPLKLVTSALQQLREHFFLFNQRHVGQTQVRFTVSDGLVKGWLEFGNELYRLEDFRGVYLRFMDDGDLPEISNEPPDSILHIHSRSVHEALITWIELTDARVVNRPSAMSSNNSKPFQAQLIRASGLRVPETLITNDPDLVREFRQRHGKVIYKSISGIRSIVQTLEEKDLERIEKIRWCPTQFQEFIEGANVRVHVIGKRAFATRVQSEAVDYRYAQDQVGESAELKEYDLCPETAARCVEVAEALGLPFAGIDLKITPGGEVYCFEVNPCPGFSYYESNTGQPIAMAVAEYLSGRVAVDDPGPARVVAPGGG